MPKFHSSVVADRPVSAVFEFVADVQNRLKYQETLAESTPLSDAVKGLGATVDDVRVVGGGRRMEFRTEVTDFEQDRLIGWRSVSKTSTAEGTVSFEEAEGGTRVDTLAEFKPKGLFWLIMWFIKGTIQRQFEDDASSLKKVAEEEISG